ncbi:MAG: AmmeMemoRadiSam system protein B [bacterium]
MLSRKPAVAGQFYPGTKADILTKLEGLTERVAEKEKALGVMSPHAGWMFSGRGAGIVFSRVEIPQTVVVLCPNHRGAGADMAVMAEGVWELPSGNIEIESGFAGTLLDKCPSLSDDHRAHAAEHSLEVQLPFIQYFRPDFKLVPVSLGRVGLEECRELGTALSEAAAEYGEEVLVVASTDMTHFESSASAEKKDKLALDRVRALDPEGLFNTVVKNRISMCGFLPVTAMLVYALERGASEASLIDYRNSGDVTGDYGEVVAYASVIVK